MTDAEYKPGEAFAKKVRWPWLVEVSPMTDQERLVAVGEYLRSETPQVSERLARAFGLTLDPWVYAKCASNPGVLPAAMAAFLESLAGRLAEPVAVCLDNRRYRKESAEGVVDPVLDQLGGSKIALGVCGNAAVAHVDGHGADTDRFCGADQALVLETDDDCSQ